MEARTTVAGAVALLLITSQVALGQGRTVTTRAADGVTVYGEAYFGELGSTAPLVLLFHQAGSNGRGEYGDLAGWLNAAGYRAIAWDLRSGGGLYGRSNRTAAAAGPAADVGYCDVVPDLQAALDYVVSEALAETVVLWGSSYSGSLVFALAARNPEHVAGVIAFSPAPGGPMVDCRARQWADSVRAPIAVFRPASEMEVASVVEQRDILARAGADVHVVDNGVHGSSMLVDDRTGQDMGGARADVLSWLRGVAPPGR